MSFFFIGSLAYLGCLWQLRIYPALAYALENSAFDSSPFWSVSSSVKFSLDTFYFLISGILVMWMAAGFAMLEAGLVRSKNTTEILTKNIALYSIACTMFLLVGYNIMYVDNVEGGIIPSFGGLIGSQAADADHSLESDFSSK